MHKRMPNLILIFVLVVFLMPFFTEAACADDGHVVRLRIEGFNETLFNRDITVTDEVYGDELIISAIGEDNTDIDDGWIKEFFGEKPLNYGSSFSIDGEEIVGSENYNWSWMNYYRIGDEIKTDKAINQIKLAEVDEIVCYICAFDSTWNTLTLIPNVELDVSNNTCDISVTDGVYSLEDINIKVSYLDNMKTDSDGESSFEIGRGIYDVIISDDGNYPGIVRYHAVIEGEGSILIEETLEDLKSYIESKDKYTALEIRALAFQNEDIIKLQTLGSKFGLKSASLTGKIMGLLALGKDPSDYEGEDYVAELIDSEYSPYKATHAFNMLSLDMAEADYDIESAVNYLIDAQNENGSFGYGDVDTTAMVITYLVNHIDLDLTEGSIGGSINSALSFLKTQQLDSGGFGYEYSGTSYESACSTSAVIQALIANDINPLSNEWMKNGNTMVDALINLRSSYNALDFEQSFAALASLYRGKSMYQNIEQYIIWKSSVEQIYDFTIERAGTGNFAKGEEAYFEAIIENFSNNKEEVTLIVVLVDEDTNEMINYSYLTKILEAGEINNIGAGFLIADDNRNYIVKAFLWDNMDDMNVLADNLVVEVD